MPVAYGSTLWGLEGIRVAIEVDAGRGLPAFHIVGRGDVVIQESRDRIRAAFRSSGLEFPQSRVTVNLAPSDLPKSGCSLDLAIAVGIAATRKEIPQQALERTLLIGELGLDGSLRPVRGTLALAATAALHGMTQVIVPVEAAAEAMLCGGIDVRTAPDLTSAIKHLAGDALLPRADAMTPLFPTTPSVDLAEIVGQESAKRALEIAAAGGHNLLLAGPPGAGKTLLAGRLADLLPDLDIDAAIEVLRIQSVAGLAACGRLDVRPPLRSPHHTISDVGLTGGGRPLRPGELSLAHRGVLFLDELPEYRRSALEALRQPLEAGVIHVTRAHGTVALPARFQLVAAMNPCPCGYAGDAQRECRCGPGIERRYRAKVSGPLLDRIDLHVWVAAVPWTRATPVSAPHGTREVRGRVERARERQRARSEELNAQLSSARLDHPAWLDSASRSWLHSAMSRLGLSFRAYTRVLRVARTIADLAGTERIERDALCEALGYRDVPGPEI